VMQGDGRSPTARHQKEETMTVTQQITGPTTTLHWEAPGPGFWRLDDSHFPKAATGYFIEALTEIGSILTFQGFRDYGLLVAGYEVGAVNSYLYLQPRLAGAPAKSGRGRRGTPPPFLLRLLFALHPELRYRKKRAALAFATKLWRHDRARWQHELEPRLRARLQALQQVDPTGLDDAALHQHMHATRRAFFEGYQLHANLLPVAVLPVDGRHACRGLAGAAGTRTGGYGSFDAAGSSRRGSAQRTCGPRDSP